MIDILKPMIQKFMPFAQKQMGFNRVPRLFLKNDENEASNPMGRTGYYDPQEESITIYIGKRHPKDIMRSLSHELMHHTQKCNGEFDDVSTMGEEGYAQTNPQMRSMEIQAYKASIVFRDWEDSTKGTIYYEHLRRGENKMSTKDWKNGELTTILSEAFGFKFSLDRLNEGSVGSGAAETLAEDDEGEETQHYGEDESADKREEDDLEHDEDDDSTKHHLDGIEHHLKSLRKDMHYDEEHVWKEGADENPIEEVVATKRQTNPRPRLGKKCKDAKGEVVGCSEPGAQPMEEDAPTARTADEGSLEEAIRAILAQHLSNIEG